MRYGCLEAGGTKMVLAIATEEGTILERTEIPTTEPVSTMGNILSWFQKRELDALGVAAFGPICLNPENPWYGHILETTKSTWRYYDLLGSLSCLQVPMGLDTDVNGSCLGEAHYGAARGMKDVLYLTVGTGIGAGILIDGKPIHGMLHPECGHVRVVRAEGDTAKSVCPYHDNCVEGLASGSAIRARYGYKAEELIGQEKVWELEAEYLAQAVYSYILTVSPKKIILGGGVLHQKQLFPMIRERVSKLLNGYLVTEELKNMETYICEPGLGDDQGILGCLVLAKQAKQRFERYGGTNGNL